MCASSWTTGEYSPSNLSSLPRVDPAAVPDGNQRTAIELAADYCHVEVFEMLAPLMEGTEALKKSSNVLNSAKIRAMYDMIDNTDSPSEEFKEYLSSVPVELVRANVGSYYCFFCS